MEWVITKLLLLLLLLLLCNTFFGVNNNFANFRYSAELMFI